MLLTVSGNQAPGNHRGQPGTGSPPQLACWLIPHRLAAERPLAIQICPVGRQQQPGFPMLAITWQQLHAQTSQLGSSQSRCRPATLSTMTPIGVTTRTTNYVPNNSELPAARRRPSASPICGR